MRIALGARPPRFWECCVIVAAAVLLARRPLPTSPGVARAALSPASPSAGATPARAAGPAADRGTLRLLTYNVAGLPEGISRSRPRFNVPLISPLLNRYGLVLVQEDFAYPAELRRDLDHPFRSPAHTGSMLDPGDGLSRFARRPFRGLLREAWRACHGVLAAGSDCLAPKGFSVATHELAAGASVDVYNLHMDAGFRHADRAARRAQIDQLIAHIAHRSAGRAVIVAGDTNLRRRDGDLLEALMAGADLRDSCRDLGCPEPGRVDRVLYRSSPAIELDARSWRTDPAFRDAAGRPLSDHRAVAVLLDWRRRSSSISAEGTEPRAVR